MSLCSGGPNLSQLGGASTCGSVWSREGDETHGRDFGERLSAQWTMPGENTHEISWNTYCHSGSTCHICSCFDLFMLATLLLCAQLPPIGSNPTVTLPLRILQCDPRSFAFEPWWWNHGDAKENALRRRSFLMNKNWPLRNCWFSGVTYQDSNN